MTDEPTCSHGRIIFCLECAKEDNNLYHEIAMIADELAFWKHQAIYWRAYVGKERGKPVDDRLLRNAEAILEEARREENSERSAHAEAPRDIGS